MTSGSGAASAVFLALLFVTMDFGLRTEAPQTMAETRRAAACACGMRGSLGRFRAPEDVGTRCCHSADPAAAFAIHRDPLDRTFVVLAQAQMLTILTSDQEWPNLLADWEASTVPGRSRGDYGDGIRRFYGLKRPQSANLLSSSGPHLSVDQFTSTEDARGTSEQGQVM